MHERLLHALDLGMLGDWETAKRTLENLDDPLVPRLISLMTQQQRYERDRCEAQALARHELGNALSIAQANVEAMIDGVLEPSPERLHGISDALQTCGSLLDDLKKNYRERRELTQRVDTFNVCDLIAQQIRLVRSIAESKNVSVVYTNRDEQNPDCAKFLGDPDRIAHVVRNLLLSAVRYTPPAGNIEVEYIVPGSEIRLTLQHSRNAHVDSLGFPVVSKLLEAFGNDAVLTSESHASNTFVVKLPAFELLS